MLVYERDIKEWVRDATWVERVRTTPPRVASEGGGYVMRTDNGTKMVMLRGLTRLMADHLLAEPLGPRVPQDPAVRHAQELARAEKRRRQAPATMQAKLYGFMKGSRIHRQVEDYTLLDEGSFRRKYPDGMHPDAMALLRGIIGQGWRPMCAEYVCYHAKARMATRLDLICVDRAGRLVFLEVKTGYGFGAFDNDTAKTWVVGCPLGAVPATPRNQALVQLALGVAMCADNLSLPAEAYCAYVAHIDQAQLRFIQLAPAFLTTYASRLIAFVWRARLKASKEKADARSTEHAARTASAAARAVDHPLSDV
jgi:hypothetical protein